MNTKLMEKNTIYKIILSTKGKLLQLYNINVFLTGTYHSQTILVKVW